MRISVDNFRGHPLLVHAGNLDEACIELAEKVDEILNQTCESSDSYAVQWDRLEELGALEYLVKQCCTVSLS